jgi:hypothetical protein
MSHKKLAEAYYKLLTAIDWNDEILVKGLREGLNKFLSNAFASQFPKKHKHHKTHKISRAAKKQLDAKKYVGLRYEHLVPKQKYIQGPCEELAKRGELTVEYIVQLLDKYWFVATITKEEDDRLRRTSMHTGWDEENIFDRYEFAGIELLDNTYFGDQDEPRIVEIIEQIGGER